MMFADRHDAGRQLAERLAELGLGEPIVLALPRGGVPVAAEVAHRLAAPLDVLLVRKIGCPWQPELGLGAIAEGGIRTLNTRLIAEAGVDEAQIEAIISRETQEIERRARGYRGDRPAIAVSGRLVILVDDGLATGFTARAAIELLRMKGASRVVLAAPVAPAETVMELDSIADQVVVLATPAWFFAIGEHYVDFRQTSDEEVVSLLEAARAEREEQPGVAAPTGKARR
jgi:putative phosphoribosyl transferase